MLSTTHDVVDLGYRSAGRQTFDTLMLTVFVTAFGVTNLLADIKYNWWSRFKYAHISFRDRIQPSWSYLKLGDPG